MPWLKEGSIVHRMLKVKASYKEGQALDVDELLDHVGDIFSLLQSSHS